MTIENINKGTNAVKELERKVNRVVLVVEKCMEILRTTEEFNSLKPAALWSAVKTSQKTANETNVKVATTTIIPTVDLFAQMKEKGLLNQLEEVLRDTSSPKLPSTKSTVPSNPRRQVSLEVLMPLASALSGCYAQLDEIPPPSKVVALSKRKGAKSKQPPPPPGMLSLQNYTNIGAFMEFMVCTSILPFLEPYILFPVEDRARYFLPKSLAGRICRPSLLWGCFREQNIHIELGEGPSDHLQQVMIELKTVVVVLGNLLLLDRFRPMLLPRHLADLYAAIFQAEKYSLEMQQSAQKGLTPNAPHVTGSPGMRRFSREQEYQAVVSRLLPRMHGVSPKDSTALGQIDPGLQAQSLQSLLLQGTKSPLWLRQRVSKQLTEMACRNLSVIIQIFVHAAPPKDKTAASLRLARTLLTGRQTRNESESKTQNLYYHRLCQQVLQILDNALVASAGRPAAFSSKQILDIHTLWFILDHIPALEMQQRMLILLGEGMLESSTNSEASADAVAIHRSVDRIAVLLSSIPPSFNPAKVAQVFLIPLTQKVEAPEALQIGTKPTIFGQLLRLACLPPPVLKTNFQDDVLRSLRPVVQTIMTSKFSLEPSSSHKKNSNSIQKKSAVDSVEVAALALVYSSALSSWDLCGKKYKRESRPASPLPQTESYDAIRVEHSHQPFVDAAGIVKSVEDRVKLVLDKVLLPLMGTSGSNKSDDSSERQCPSSLASTLFFLVLLMYFSPTGSQTKSVATPILRSLFPRQPGSDSNGMFRIVAMCFLPLLCEICPMESLLESSQNDGVGIFRMMQLVFSCTGSYLSAEKLLWNTTDEIDRTEETPLEDFSVDNAEFVQSGLFVSRVIGSSAEKEDSVATDGGVLEPLTDQPAQTVDPGDLVLVVSVASLLLSLLIAIMELGTKETRSQKEEKIIDSFLYLLRPLAEASDSSWKRSSADHNSDSVKTLDVACAEIGEMAGHAMALIAAHKVPSSPGFKLSPVLGEPLSDEELVQKTFKRARTDLSSTQPPIRAKGVVSLQHFLRGDLFERILRDERAKTSNTALIVDLGEADEILGQSLVEEAVSGVLHLAISALTDKESYVYLAAIQSIAAAADRCSLDVMPRVALAVVSGMMRGSEAGETDIELSREQRVKLAEALIFCIRRRSELDSSIPMLLDVMLFGGKREHNDGSIRSDTEQVMLIHKETQNYFLRGRAEAEQEEDVEEIAEKQRVRLSTGGPLFRAEEDDVLTAARIAIVSELVTAGNPSTLAIYCHVISKTATDLLRLDASRPVRRAAAFLAREIFTAAGREQNELLDNLARSSDSTPFDIELSVALMSSTDDEILSSALQRCLSADDLGDISKSSHRLFDSSTAARCQEAMDARQECVDGGIFAVARLVVESRKRESKLPASKLVRELLSKTITDATQAVESLRSLEINTDTLELTPTS